ncbi:unnamed protein product [Albugo candida]|uniref:Uncharacterized protein n=1 Tax=Albugo candida TaxID=65357 RepID=A0A024GA55_9STRA|nr:unnamed protein product [Albugo candida]|eukprot:CCI43653.1 unnamed protein product [Albugo candida]
MNMLLETARQQTPKRKLDKQQTSVKYVQNAFGYSSTRFKERKTKSVCGYATKGGDITSTEIQIVCAVFVKLGPRQFTSRDCKRLNRGNTKKTFKVTLVKKIVWMPDGLIRFGRRYKDNGKEARLFESNFQTVSHEICKR